MILTIYIFIVNCLKSISIWIETNSDLITASATAVIALFTLTLFCATRKLWKVSQGQSKLLKKSIAVAQRAANAAQDSADALPAMERAYLFVKIIRAGDVRGDEFNTGLKELPGTNKVEIIITNHGKTSAILKRFTITNNIYFSEKVDLIFPFGTELIEGGKYISYFTRFYIHDANEYEEVTRDESNLICQGIVQYSDVFDISHVEVGFSWQWYELFDRFIPYKQGNYRKQINQD